MGITAGTGAASLAASPRRVAEVAPCLRPKWRFRAERRLRALAPIVRLQSFRIPRSRGADASFAAQCNSLARAARADPVVACRSLAFSRTPGASGLAELVTPLKRYEFVPAARRRHCGYLRRSRASSRRCVCTGVHPMNPVPSVTAAAVCHRGDSRAGELKLQMISEHDALINLRR